MAVFDVCCLFVVMFGCVGWVCVVCGGVSIFLASLKYKVYYTVYYEKG